MLAMIIPIRRPPTWPLRLSNAQLLAEFELALDARGPQEPPGHFLLRLDLLHDEIRRRDRFGTLTDDDWQDGPSSRQTQRPSCPPY